MFDVFLCYAAADRALAGTIVDRLSREECNVIVDECGHDPDATVAAAWEAGLECGAIVLLLSPDSVPPTPSRSLWGGLLEHITEARRPAIAAVFYPPVRRSFIART